jgi:hypothetical protein
MRTYRTMEVVRLYTGSIGLSDHQARLRGHNLCPISVGIYEITGPVCFKAGEKIKLDAPDKAIISKLNCLDSPMAEDNEPEKQENEVTYVKPKRGRKPKK